ncbi:MAG: glycosyltransferase [Desulfovibrionaceae bacterium]|nr:glycosyltransferase [Desulfovibrionaceae bacterium]
METEKKLRILLILPLYGGSLPIGRFCASALRDLGHLVEEFEAPDFYPAFSAFKALRVNSDRREYLENSFLQLISQAILAKAETFEPDLVMSVAQAPLSRQALKKLNKDGITTAMWFMEDHRLFTYWKAFAPYYDFFAVIQKEPILEELEKLGVNSFYLPMAALPDFHRQEKLSALDKNRFGSDLSFMGAGYPNRRVAFRQLVNYDFKIWGTEWDAEPALAPFVQLSGARISPEDCVKIYNASKINLNLHSSVQSNRLVTHGDFVNPRTFELAGCAAFQLTDARSLLPELFDPEELATFGSMEELLDLIPYYLNNDAKRLEMARAARARVLREHTYQQRMRTMLEFISGKKPDWPPVRNRYQGFMNSLPAEIAPQAAELLTRLNLPASVAFEDVVWELRKQQGELSDLEAAILFLDEWKKQYA